MYSRSNSDEISGENEDLSLLQSYKETWLNYVHAWGPGKMQSLEEINLRYLGEISYTKYWRSCIVTLPSNKTQEKNYSLLSLFLNSKSTNVIIYTRETTETKK